MELTATSSIYNKTFEAKIRGQKLSKKGLCEFIRKHSNTIYSLVELKKLLMVELKSHASSLKYKG